MSTSGRLVFVTTHGEPTVSLVAGRLGAPRRLVALSAFIRVRLVVCFLTQVDRRFGVARRLPEVDAGLVGPRLQQARFSTRLHVRRREPDEAEPVGVGEPVADPRLRVASDLAHVQLAHADDRELPSPVDGCHVEHRVLRAVVRRLADELSHARREHPPVPDGNVRETLAQGAEVGCVEGARRRVRLDQDGVESQAVPGRRDRAGEVRRLAQHWTGIDDEPLDQCRNGRLRRQQP